MLKHCNIPVFVSHSGCPHDCIFCNQKTITGTSDGADGDFVRQTVSEYLATIGSGATVQLAFFGGSFTGIPKCRQQELLSAGYEYIKKGQIDSIRISTRPDYIDEETLLFLKQYGVKAIELGMQSSDDGVLAANERGHSSDTTVAAAKLIKQHGFELGLQMMTGLYKSSPEKDIATAREIVRLGADTTRIYPTMVLAGTKLCRLYEQGLYIPPTLEENVSLCAEIFEIFSDAGITVLRVGLQSTDTICENGRIVAGAYHSAFGELVQSRIIRKKLEQLALHTASDEITVEVKKSDVSKTVGNKRCNITYIKEKFGKNVIIKQI